LIQRKGAKAGRVHYEVARIETSGGAKEYERVGGKENHGEAETRSYNTIGREKAHVVP
jgi:hypothetical protein